jgi:RNA polymerase sigma-70 factor, ECF subfamily
MITPLPNEPELLKQCAGGDTGAFGQLVTHYEDVTFNMVYRMVGNREDARDVTQEVFIKAFRRIGSFESRSSFVTWLYSIAFNQSISHRRRMGAKSRAGSVQMSVLDGADDGAKFQPAAGGPAPDGRMLSAETRQEIENAIDKLDDDHRAVVILRDIEGLDYNSIGDVLGCSRGTIKSRLHRARLELRQRLKGLTVA